MAYIYGKDKEDYKKALHYAIYFNSFDLSDKLVGVDLRPIQSCPTRQERYLMTKRLIGDAYSGNTPLLPLDSKTTGGSEECRLQNCEQHGRLSVQKKRTDLENLERHSRMLLPRQTAGEPRTAQQACLTPPHFLALNSRATRRQQG